VSDHELRHSADLHTVNDITISFRMPTTSVTFYKGGAPTCCEKATPRRAQSGVIYRLVFHPPPDAV
jgi:hypothetical protein